MSVTDYIKDSVSTAYQWGLNYVDDTYDFFREELLNSLTLRASPLEQIRGSIIWITTSVGTSLISGGTTLLLAVVFALALLVGVGRWTLGLINSIGDN